MYERMYEQVVRVEQANRQAAFSRALGDPERGWLVDAGANRGAFRLGLGGLARSLRALALALVAGP